MTFRKEMVDLYVLLWVHEILTGTRVSIVSWIKESGRALRMPLSVNYSLFCGLFVGGNFDG